MSAAAPDRCPRCGAALVRSSLPDGRVLVGCPFPGAVDGFSGYREPACGWAATTEVERDRAADALTRTREAACE